LSNKPITIQGDDLCIMACECGKPLDWQLNPITEDIFWWADCCDKEYTAWPKTITVEINNKEEDDEDKV